MDKWVIDNIRDCLLYGYSFTWFIHSDDYLHYYNMDDLKATWEKQQEILAKL